MQVAVVGVKVVETVAAPSYFANAHPLKISAGETATIDVAVVDSAGNPVDLTGGQLLLTVKTSPSDVNPLVSRQATLGTPNTAGKASFPLVVADTLTLLGVYGWDVWLTDAAGNRFDVVPFSTFQVTPALGQPGQAVTVPPAQAPLALGPTGPQGPPGQGGILADTFPGADIGAKINAACASLPGGGTVVTLDGDHVMTTRVVVEAGITLRLGRGTYSNSFAAAGGAVWKLKDNAKIIGAGWETKLMPPIMGVGDNGVSVVTDYVSATDNSLPGNVGVSVSDVQCIRNPASTTAGVQTAAIQFGNVRNARVSRVYFNGCEGYGVFQASSSGTGNHGDGFVIEDCLFENITTQQCGVINCANWSIRNNLFRPTTAAANFTVVDCEANTSGDVLRNFQIVDNTFDFTTNPIFNPGTMIQVLGGGGAPLPYKSAYGGRATYGEISRNVCVSGDFTTNKSYFGQGINLVNCDEVEVADNKVFGANIPIEIGTCNSIHVYGNATGYGKNNDAWHVLVTDSFDCLVENNKCVEHFGAGWSTPNIAEQGTSDYNIFKQNHVAFYPYVNTVTSGGRYAKIDLVGAHSRVMNNVMGPVPTPVDAPLVTSTAELRALDIPGSRPAAAPAVVMLGGRAAQADGGWSVWKYDPTSTATDNDVTVVKPSNAAAQWNGVGRWLKAPGGFKLTTLARNALTLTAADAGLSIWNTDTTQFEVWNGSAWVSVGGGAATGNFVFSGNGVDLGAAAVMTLGGANASEIDFKFGSATTVKAKLVDLGGVFALYLGTTEYIYGGAGNIIMRVNGGAQQLEVNPASVNPGNDNAMSSGKITQRWSAVWSLLYGTKLGAAIVSAATIAPTSGIHHITGSVGISTITPPVTGFVGTIKLITDAALSFVAGGNIAASGQITTAAGQVYDATFDGTNWYIK